MSGYAKLLGCHLLIDATHGLIGPDDKKAIYERLLIRNSIRREIGVRPINIPEMYRRKIKMMAEKKYDELIQPLVDAAFSKIEWPNSFTGRLLLATKTYRQCAARLEAETGCSNPRRVGPDMLDLIHQYVAPFEDRGWLSSPNDVENNDC